MKRTSTLNKKSQRLARHVRVRTKINVAEFPRLTTFRSNKHVYAQIIDDKVAKTLVAASDVKSSTKSKIEKAKEVGLVIAKKATAQKIAKVVFDRGGFKYHGRLKALAQGAREGGLKF